MLSRNPVSDYLLKISSIDGETPYLLSISPDGKIDPISNWGITEGFFVADTTGKVGVDYLFDGGSYQGELAIFSLKGMENLSLGSSEFITEAARRASSNSQLGYVVISDSLEGAKFSIGNNSGEYLGRKTFSMSPGDVFAAMLVPNGTVLEVYDNPLIGGNKRPLFSLATANPSDAFHVGQVGDITGDGSAFVIEDLRVDTGTDRDYNDIIWQFSGAIGLATPVAELIAPEKDWRDSPEGQKLLSSIIVPPLLDDEPPFITANLTDDTGRSNSDVASATRSDRITSDPTIKGKAIESGKIAQFVGGFDALNLTDVSAFLAEDGSFTFDRETLESIYRDSLTDGNYTLYLQAADELGNVSNVFSFEFTLNTTAPNAIIGLAIADDTPPVGDGETVTTPVTLVGQTEASVEVVLLETGATTTSDETGAFSFPEVALKLGDNLFEIQVTDVAGNVGKIQQNITRKEPFQPETDPPTISIELVEDTGNDNSDAITSNPAVTGTVSDESAISQFVVGFNPSNLTNVTSDLDSSGNFSFNREKLSAIFGETLPDGTHTLYLQAVDAEGNLSSLVEFEFTLDTTEPILTVEVAASDDTPPVGDGETETSPVTLIGQTSPGLTVTLLSTGTTTTADENGQFYFDGLELLEGENSFTVAPTDVAGNIGQTHYTLTYVLPMAATPDIILTESDDFSTSYSATIEIPSSAASLTFTIADLVFDPNDPDGINDAFEVALLDEKGKSLVHTIASGKNAFFNWTEGEEVLLGTGASYDLETGRVTVNLSEISAGTNATLVFRLINEDTDTNTSVRINNITLVAATEVSPLQTSFKPPNTGAISPEQFNYMSDISASFKPEYGTTSFNGETQELYADVAIRNQGTYSVDSPLLVAVANISEPTVLVRDPDGFTPEGLPYYNFSHLVENGQLDPGEITEDGSLLFYNPNQVKFTYDLVILGQLNSAPKISSKPLEEIVGGLPYRYEVIATDINHDDLTYSLLSAPNGMTIDELTGIVNWSTTTEDIGSHSIEIEVADFRGGKDVQRFNLSVTEVRPNRPPIIHSTPMVDAKVNTSYRYNIKASDPDENKLTYELVDAPDDMEIDSETGSIIWQPLAGDVGIHDLTLKVVDSAGATTTQEFQILVQPELGNSAPIIISDPLMVGYSNDDYVYELRAIDPDSDELIYNLVNSPEGMTVDPITGEIVWNDLTDENIGVHDITVEVQDNRGGVDSQTFQLTIGNDAELGEIRGIKWLDSNQNSIFDAEESGLAGIEIYLDLNQNGILDIGEPSTTTTADNPDTTEVDETGHYRFTHLTPDTYTVRELITSYYEQTYPFASPILGENLIQNGSFEFASFNPGRYSGLRTGSTAIEGWEITLGTIDYIGSYWEAADGDRSIDLNGTSPGAIQQTINTIPGQDYLVTFDLSANPDSSKDPKPMTVSAAGQSAEFLGVPSSRTNMNYEPQGWQFTAHSNNTIIEFSSGVERFFGAAIDNVAVAQIIGSQRAHTVELESGQIVENIDFGNSEREIPPPNGSPTFISTPPTEVSQSEMFRYNAIATDPDADTLVYDLPGKPEGMVIDPETGIIVWQPTAAQRNESNNVYLDAGTYNVLVRAKDNRGGVDLQSFQVTITPPNNPPVFTVPSPTEIQPQIGKPFEYYFTAYDADGDVDLSYDLLTPITGATLDPETGIFSWTPTQTGEFELTVKATDPEGNETFQNITATVVEPRPNTPPTLPATPNNSARIGAQYLYQLPRTDFEGDPLSFNLLEIPTGMELDDQNRLVWTPTADQFGTQTISLEISDGSDTTEVNWTVDVSNTTVNRAPTITSTPNLITNLERVYQYQLEAFDPDGDLLLWTLDRAPSGMVVDPQSGMLSWQPTSDQIGNHTIQVQVADSGGLFVGQEFELTVRGINTPPAIVSTPDTIGAVGQEYRYQVTATDPENDPLRYSLGNAGSGMQIDAETGLLTWTPTESQAGNVEVEVLVIDDQDGVNRQAFTIEVATAENAPVQANRAPVITSTAPYLAATGVPYTYQIEAIDADGDALVYELIKPSSSGLPLSKGDGRGIEIDLDTNTGLLTWNNPTIGSHQIVVGTNDGRLGAAQAFTLTVQNNLPPVVDINNAPTVAVPNQLYRYDISAYDPNGTTLTYQLDDNSLALGMTVDELGRLSWTPTETQVGTHPVTIEVIDELGTATTQTFNLTVSGDTEAPQVNLIPSNVFVVDGNFQMPLGDEVTFFTNATDNIGVSGLQLFINDVPVALSANGVAAFTPTELGIISAKAYAYDAAGNSGESLVEIRVLNPNDTAPPVVELSPSISDEPITDLTDIIGTVTDDNLVNYKLQIAPAAGGEFVTIAEGDSSIANGNLGVFDPTTLQNDSYILRLEATDANGQTSSTERIVEVTGELKLGNFRLSFTDLEIPVAGIPISVTRTYDTLTAKSQDDFGYGWRLEFRDTDLRTSVKAPTEQQQLLGIPAAFDDNTRVYVTLPGGDRTSFTFNPTGDRLNAFLGSAGSAALWYHPAFKSEDGSDVTLSVDDVRLVKGPDGKYYDLGGAAYNPENPRFGGSYTLTTKEGIEYQIDAFSGDLLTVTDTNGNTLTYSDSGITSDTGQSVTFERNAAGQIIAAVDPEGNKIQYEYDENGDLVAVTDREENTTRFEYHEERVHYLDEVIDPLGRSGVRTEYDESGRLSRMLDVNGEAVELVYDPDNSTQTVLDVFGNPTTYVYDDRGNVVTEVDALGGITRRTFDDNNNLLSETNPENESMTFQYDSQGNRIAYTDPLGHTTRYAFNRFGKLLTRTNPLGDTTTSTYDNWGNRLTLTNIKGNTLKYVFDSKGNLTEIADAAGNSTQLEYDLVGNVIREVDAIGNETAYTYDINGNILTETKTVTTSEGLQTRVASWTYDKENRIKTMTDPLGKVIRYEYDQIGNLIATIEEGMNERRTEYEYNDSGKLIKKIYPDGTSEHTTYDRAGREIAKIDRLGQTTNFVYDALGRLIETIYPDDTQSDLSDNPRTKTEYDLADRATASIDERGNRTEYEYDAAGRLVLVRDALGNETTYTYDALGNRLTETDARNNTTRFVYDELGRVVQTHYADGTHTATSYNILGLKSSETDQLGRTTHFIYDALDRLVEVIYPDDTPDNLSDNPRTKTEYNEIGQVIAEIDELDNRNEYEYDAASRLIESRSNCSCRRRTYTYDAAGNRLTETDPLNRTTEFVYDRLDRLIETHFPDGSYETITYDDLGRPVAQTDQNGKTTEFKYDEANRLTTVIDALQQQTEYEYDLTGNLIQVKDANQQITKYEYDSLNRRTATILPMGQRSETDYDEVGNIARDTDFNEDIITYDYDELNRIIAKQFGDSPLVQVEYNYTPTGQIKNVVNERGTTTYEYDERERAIAKTEPDGNFIRYTYDKASNKTAVITPNGTTKYVYDKFNQLQKITDPSGAVTEYTYDQAGNIIETQFPNNPLEVREYDALDRLLFLKHSLIDPITSSEIETLSSFSYELDNVGNRLSVLDGDNRLVEYNYDALYRLTSEKNIGADGATRTIDYVYDAVGNRLTSNDSERGLTSYTYNNNDWLLRQEINGEEITYSYDNNGNMLSQIKDSTDKVTYVWNPENRLIEAEVTTPTDKQTIEYQYNHDGVRVGKTADDEETRYLIDDNIPHAQVLEEYAPDGKVYASYTYGHDLISQQQNEQKSFYHFDGLGSTKVLTDANGDVTDTYSYDAYGNLIASTGNTANNYLFAGEQYDPDLNQYYLRARYYAPNTGRFTARDPFEGWLTEPLSLAKYPYVHGNPVNLTDPSGLFVSTEQLTAIKIVGILAGLSQLSVFFPKNNPNILVPDYLKEENQKGVNKLVDTPIDEDDYLAWRGVVATHMECNQIRGSGEECDFGYFPVIFWGTDLPQVKAHTEDAFLRRLPAFLARISPPWSRNLTIDDEITIKNRHNKWNEELRNPYNSWYNVPKNSSCYWNPYKYQPQFQNADCDEYPYASTLWGGRANYHHGSKVSLRLVNRQQNQAQGDLLFNFYTNAPIIPNHPIRSWFGVQTTAQNSYWIR